MRGRQIYCALYLREKPGEYTTQSRAHNHVPLPCSSNEGESKAETHEETELGAERSLVVDAEGQVL